MSFLANCLELPAETKVRLTSELKKELDSQLKGKRALVAGAISGLGEAIARMLEVNCRKTAHHPETLDIQVH